MSAKDLEAALASLEKAALAKQRPSHHLARQLLLALGRALREDVPDASAPWLERARTAGTTLGPAWKEAVQDELTLACGEFAQCLDPRYLGLPNYDWDYTRTARARLEDRLRAAEQLGFRPTPKELELLALADQVLEASSLRRPEGGVRETPPNGPAGRPEALDRPSHKRERK